MDVLRNDLTVRSNNKRRMFLALGAAGVMLAIAAGLWFVRLATPELARSSLWIDTVHRGDLLREVSGAGSLEPRDSRWITTLTPARVEAILVKPGSAVKADTVIMELSQPDLLDESEMAQADLKAFAADVAVRRLTLQNQLLDQRAVIAAASNAAKSAQLQADAEQQLQEAHVVPELQVKRNIMAAASAAAKLAFEQERLATLNRSLTAQAAADAARLDQKRATAALRQHQVEALHVRAAIDGVLQQVAVEVGQQIGEGGNLARVAKLDDLIAHLRIPEVEASALRDGQEVRIDTRNGLVQGSLSRIDPTVNSGTVTVDVELQGALPPGTRLDQNVMGVVEIERLHDVLYVGRPAQAAPLTSATVFKLNAGGNAALRTPVRFGRASANNIEIVGGLAEGDKVILSDLSQWEKSDRLRVD